MEATVMRPPVVTHGVSHEYPAPDDYAETVVPAEVAHEIMNSVMGHISARIFQIEDSEPAEVERLRAIRLRLRREKNQIRCATPDHSNAVSAKWGALLKDDAALWAALNA